MIKQLVHSYTGDKLELRLDPSSSVSIAGSIVSCYHWQEKESSPQRVVTEGHP